MAANPHPVSNLRNLDNETWDSAGVVAPGQVGSGFSVLWAGHIYELDSSLSVFKSLAGFTGWELLITDTSALGEASFVWSAIVGEGGSLETLVSGKQATSTILGRNVVLGLTITPGLLATLYVNGAPVATATLGAYAPSTVPVELGETSGPDAAIGWSSAAFANVVYDAAAMQAIFTAWGGRGRLLEAITDTGNAVPPFAWEAQNTIEPLATANLRTVLNQGSSAVGILTMDSAAPLPVVAIDQDIDVTAVSAVASAVGAVSMQGAYNGGPDLTTVAGTSLVWTADAAMTTPLLQLDAAAGTGPALQLRSAAGVAELFFPDTIADRIGRIEGAAAAGASGLAGVGISLDSGAGDGAGAGGPITIAAGGGGTTADGGGCTISTGDGGATSGDAGDFFVLCGAQVDGNGGRIIMLASNAGGAANTGGAVLINSGGGAGTGTGGAWAASTGSGGASGSGGDFNFNGGAGATGGGSFNVTTGSAATSGIGGDFNIITGPGAAGRGGNAAFALGVGNAGGVGGGFSVVAGTGGASADGGAVTFAAGTGGGTAGTGGAVAIAAGDASAGSSSGGAMALATGDGAVTNGAGGAFAINIGDGMGNAAGGSGTITAGSAELTGIGGSLSLAAGGGGSTSGVGGAIDLTAGSASGGSTGGFVNIRGGNVVTGTGTSGGVIIESGSAGAGAGNTAAITVRSLGGGATGGATGFINISTGSTGVGNGNFAAGGINLFCGNSDGTSAGGGISLSAGIGGDSDGDGGAISIVAGTGGVTNGDGGSITLTAPVGTGTGADGVLTLGVGGTDYTWPAADSSPGDAMVTDGSGVLSFATIVGYETRTEYFAPQENGALGDYRTRSLAMGAVFQFSFTVPDDFGTLVSIEALMTPLADITLDGAGTDIDLDSDYGALSESIINHSESTTLTSGSFTGGEWNALDLSAVFSSLTAGDICGIEIDQNSLGTTVHYNFIKLVYTAA